jgi:hypothetical protein
MSIQTKVARCLFPQEQLFMARRKLRSAFWAVAVGAIVSAVFVVFSLLPLIHR